MFFPNRKDGTRPLVPRRQHHHHDRDRPHHWNFCILLEVVGEHALEAVNWRFGSRLFMGARSQQEACLRATRIPPEGCVVTWSDWQFKSSLDFSDFHQWHDESNTYSTTNKTRTFFKRREGRGERLLLRSGQVINHMLICGLYLFVSPSLSSPSSLSF